jgi:hypothetical protein
MLLHIAWLAPLTWAVAALVVMLVLKPRASAPSTPVSNPLRRAA